MVVEKIKITHRKRASFELLRTFFVLVLTGTVLVGCASLVRPNFTQDFSELRSGEYTLDPEHAYVHFTVGHLGLSKIVGRFNTVSGSLDFDPNAVTDLRLQGIMEADSIDVNNDELEATLKERAWFDAQTFPQIIFTSTSVVQTDNGSLDITGDLSLRGVTRAIVLNARFNGGADNFLSGKYTLGFSATTSIKRSDFGIDTFAALIGNDIDIELHGEFQRN